MMKSVVRGTRALLDGRDVKLKTALTAEIVKHSLHRQNGTFNPQKRKTKISAHSPNVILARCFSWHIASKLLFNGYSFCNLHTHCQTRHEYKPGQYRME
jgi:hypothetical protein